MRSRKAETEKTEQEEDFMLYCDAGLPQSAGPYAEASEALEKWIRNGCTPGSGFRFTGGGTRGKNNPCAGRNEKKLKEASDGGPEAAEKYGAVPGFLGTVAAAASVSAALKKAAAAGAETVRVYCAPDGGGKTEAVLRIGNLPRAEIRHGRIMFAVPKGGFSGRTAAELERAGLPGDRLFPENITEISYGGRTLYPQKQ